MENIFPWIFFAEYVLPIENPSGRERLQNSTRNSRLIHKRIQQKNREREKLWNVVRKNKKIKKKKKSKRMMGGLFE